MAELERIPDLAFEFDGDLINLEQDGGPEGADRISLHVIQLRLLAERAGLLASGGFTALERRLAKRLRMLADRVIWMAGVLMPAPESDADYTSEEVISREVAGMAKTMLAELEDYFEGNDEPEPERPSYGPVSAEQQARNCAVLAGHGGGECHEEATPNSVTRRGRKPLGDAAMTDAERQRRHRQKAEQANLALGEAAQ